MGRRKKKDIEEDGVGIPSLGEEARRWIFALASFGGMVFLILASFDKAGLVGKTIFIFLSSSFGFGYYLFPITLLLIGGTILRSDRRALLFTSSGLALFFFSGLAGIELAVKNGGAVGKMLAGTLVTFFDIYASFVIIGTLFLVSLLLITNTAPSFAWFSNLFRKKDTDEKGREAAETPREDAGDTVEKEYAQEEEPLKKIFGLPVGIDTKKTMGAPKDAYARLALHYKNPPLELLQGDRGKPGVGDIKANANIIKRTLQNFGIDVEMDEVSVGPSVTRYSLKPAQGVKLARIVGLKNDLSLALAAHPLRIEAPIPGKSLVGIELPNTSRTTVGLATLLSQDDYKTSEKPLLVALGRGVTGKPHFGDLAKMPHLLIAGATGSGKSVAIHTIVVSLLYNNSPASLRFIMIDPKRVELTLYNKTPHLLTPVITDSKKAILALKWAIKEMERRYDILETESVRDIGSYHKNIVAPAYERLSKKQVSEAMNLALPERMPYIVIVLDELADIMSTYPRELEASIVRLAQMSRAVGIHLILSTQRPSVNVITGLIKANIPVRMAFQVPSQIDSRTILDVGGAETLLGAGDMLYVSGEMSKPVRLQSAFISESEIKKVVQFLSNDDGHTTSDILFSEGSRHEIDPLFNSLERGNDGFGEEDELFPEARETVVRTARASTTFLQRKFRIGYARAARLMDILEERGIVGPADGAKPREVLVKEEGRSEYSEGENNDIEKEPDGRAGKIEEGA